MRVGRPTKMTPATLKALRQYRAQGKTVREVATLLGEPSATVGRWLQKYTGPAAARCAHAQKERKKHLMAAYGMTLEEHEGAWRAVGRRCEICRKPAKVPATDHDHHTGKFRGLLCFRCNRLLGAAKEKPAILIAAALYLLRPGT